MTQTMRDKAVALAAQGFSVFPLAAGTKDKPIAPFGPVEKGKYFDVVPSSDPKLVYAMWSDHDGDLGYNIGICTNNLLVFDLDVKEGKNGVKAWLALSEELGLGSTVVARTPSGGRHLFYKLPNCGKARNTVGELGEGVDTRGWHGYVVAPGSVVPAGEYQWLHDEPEIEKMATATERALARVLAKPAERERAAVIAGLELDQQAAIDRARAWLIDHAPVAQEGCGGDGMTYQVACRVRSFGVSEPEALALMAEHWNPEKAIPPWDMAGLEKKVANAYAYAQDPAGARSAEADFEPVELETDQGVSGNLNSAYNSEWETWSFEQAAEQGAIVEDDELVEGYLERGAMSVLYGESNTGKTFVALDFAYHIAVKKEWNGRKVKGGVVLYIAAEAGRKVRKRVTALKLHYKPGERVPLVTSPALVDMHKNRVDLCKLVELVKRLEEEYGEKVVMIVLDTLARVIGGGDENTAQDMGKLVGNVDRLRQETGAHVMVVHHSGKDTSKGARGSSALRAATDTEIEIKDGKIVSRKQRDMEIARAAEFRLKVVEIGKKPEGQSVTSCVVEVGASVDFEPQPTNGETADEIAALRSVLKELDTTTFTRTDVEAALGVSLNTARRRIDAWAGANLVKVEQEAEGKPTVYTLPNPTHG